MRSPGWQVSSVAVDLVRDLAEAVRSAHASVVEAGIDPDSPAGVAAIQEILRHLLMAPAHSPVGQPGRDTQELSPAGRVAQWAQVDESVLLDVVSFGDDGVGLELSSRHLPRTKAGRQRFLVLLKLVLDGVAYGREESSGEAINELCERYDCLDQNLPTNLRNSDLISVRGESRAYRYRATRDGIDEGRQWIREILGAT